MKGNPNLPEGFEEEMVATMQFVPDSRDSASGQTIGLTATIRKPF